MFLGSSTSDLILLEIWYRLTIMAQQLPPINEILAPAQLTRMFRNQLYGVLMRLARPTDNPNVVQIRYEHGAYSAVNDYLRCLFPF